MREAILEVVLSATLRSLELWPGMALSSHQK